MDRHDDIWSQWLDASPSSSQPGVLLSGTEATKETTAKNKNRKAS